MGWSAIVDVAAGIIALVVLFLLRSVLSLRDRMTRLETLQSDFPTGRVGKVSRVRCCGNSDPQSGGADDD